MAIPWAARWLCGRGGIARRHRRVGARWFGVHAESWRWAFFLVVIPTGARREFFMREPPRDKRPGETGTTSDKVTVK